MLWNRERCIARARHRTPAVQPVASRHTDLAIPARLSQIVNLFTIYSYLQEANNDNTYTSIF
jgi:hypothetical protein